DLITGGQSSSILIGGSAVPGATDKDNYGGTSQKRLFGGPGDDILIGNNGCANTSLVSNAFQVADNCSPIAPPIQVFDLSSTNPDVGGGDYMDGGLGNDRMFGGVGDDTMLGGGGDDYME